MEIEEAIDIICKRSKEQAKMKMWYNIVWKNGRMDADDLHQFMDMGVPIIDMYSKLHHITFEQARLGIINGDLTDIDLKHILFFHARDLLEYSTGKFNPIL